jgi:hypothetical protein
MNYRWPFRDSKFFGFGPRRQNVINPCGGHHIIFKGGAENLLKIYTDQDKTLIIILKYSGLKYKFKESVFQHPVAIVQISVHCLSSVKIVTFLFFAILTEDKQWTLKI